jgi:hypothetical protein
MDTLWFEEGVALRFGLKHSPIAVSQRREYREAMKPPWSQVFRSFTKLKPADSAIKIIRDRAQNKLFDSVTKDLIVRACGVRPNLAEELCQRLPKDSR